MSVNTKILESRVEFHERPIQYEIVILPLSRSGVCVDMLMTVVTRDGEN